MQLEVGASAVTTSIHAETEGRVASRSSSANSVSSASSALTSASSNQSVAYCGIDVETVTDVSAVQSYAKGQLLPVIQSESESDIEPDDVPVASVPASYSADVATDNVGLLSVVPQPQKEVGIQCYPVPEDVGQFWGEVISHQAWVGPTPMSYYSALQVSLEHMAQPKRR